MIKTMVLGLGNILMGDDGIGVRVVERLQGAVPGAEVLDGATSGLSLLEKLTAYEKVIVVDAVQMGKMPGEAARFSAEEILGLPENQNFSLHEIGLAEVLKIGRSLNEKFDNLVVIGVQPKDLNQGERLSPEVEAKIPEVVEMVKKEVI